MAQFMRRTWMLDVEQDYIDVTSERPTPNERWTYADRLGHAHRYDRGYPTLDVVVDEQHWCDGTEGAYNHDPHWAVDESHYECKVCREVIDPKMDPPHWPKSIPGTRSATIVGLRSDGWKITAALTEDEVQRIVSAGEDDIDARAQAVLDGVPDDRVMQAEITS